MIPLNRFFVTAIDYKFHLFIYLRKERRGNFGADLDYFCFGGFNEGVFPGVSLLSRCRLSGLPVDFAMRFGPGFSVIFM